MDRFINFELLANPVNWVIVILTLWFAAFALALIGKSSGAYGSSM